jgi:hypothetical protein
MQIIRKEMIKSQAVGIGWAKWAIENEQWKIKKQAALPSQNRLPVCDR